MLQARIRQAITRYALLRPGDTVVVAVSGGPDSVALLHVLALLARSEGWKLHAAHLHHGIRGPEADADEDLVVAMAARLGMPLSVSRLDPAVLRGAALEARARRARYAFLHDVARRTGASRIATGHTRDDQAETVLLRLLRGSGARGLSGIQPAREDGVVRPLLLASRAEVIEFLGRGKVAFRQDATNHDLRYLRNRVRHEVLPLLRALSPRIDGRLAALADALRADAEWLEASATRARRERNIAPGRPIDRTWLRDLPEAIRRRVVGAALREGGVPPDRVAGAIVAILDTLREEGATRSVPLRGGNVARVDPAEVRVERGARPEVRSSFDLPLAAPGVTHLPDGRSIEAKVGESGPPAGAREDRAERPSGGEGGPPAGHPTAFSACFDAAAIVAPLRVRSRRPGDRIRPRGFGGTRKVQDLLSEALVPPGERDRVPIVVMGEEILWIGGLRAGEIAVPGPGSGRLLVLSLRPPDHSQGL